MATMEEKKLALANYLGIDVDDLEEGYDESVFNYGNEYYRVLTDEEADEAVVDDIENLIDDIGLEAFTPAMQNWIVDNAISNTEWFDEALKEDMEYYLDDMDEENLTVELLDHGYLSENDVHYAEDDVDQDIPLVNDQNKLQDARDTYLDWLIEDAGNAYDWYVMNFGGNAVRDLIKNGELLLDYDDIASECVSWDGRGHFLAYYDGDELELDDDLYAYRTN